MDTCRKAHMKFSDECLESPRSVIKHALSGDCWKCRCDMNGIAGEKTQNLIMEVSRSKATAGFRPDRMPGLFKDLYGEKIHGRDWVSHLTPAGRLLFSTLGRAWAINGKSGGMVRALTAVRDSRGRFCREVENDI